MIVSLIVAMDEKGGIGKTGALPWRLPADLRRFKQLTMGHHLIMGRKTYQSIGRPLPGRTMIVVTRNREYQPEGCLVLGSFEAALDLARERGETEVFVIGGSEIFAQALPIADRLYLTRVHAAVQTDVSFPPFNEEAWVEKGRQLHPADEHNPYASTFRILERRDAEKIKKPG